MIRASLPPLPSSLSAGFLDDLHVFDTTAMNWTRLSFALDAPRPPARRFHGFTSAGSKLYVHGGESYAGAAFTLAKASRSRENKGMAK
jgi:hypothetical protein